MQHTMQFPCTYVLLLAILTGSIYGQIPGDTGWFGNDQTSDPFETAVNVVKAAADSNGVKLALVSGNQSRNQVRYLSSIDKTIVQYTHPSTTREESVSNLDYTFQLVSEIDVLNITQADLEDSVQIHSVWNQGFVGTGVRVGIVDSGVNKNHPALRDKVVAEKSFVSTDLGYKTDEDASDGNGHGTAVASLIVGNDTQINFRGMGFGASIISAKVASDAGWITSAGLLSGLDWLIDQQKVDIISISLSEPEEGYGIDIYEAIVAKASELGIIVVASAGNRGSSGSNPFTIGSPGSSPAAITVGSISITGEISDFSSEGPTYGYEMKPDILAPGQSIEVARFSSYSFVTGTSFSTPIVAGIIACILSSNMTLNPGELKAGLLQSSQKLQDSLFAQGAGMVNASAYLEVVSTQSPLSYTYNSSIYRQNIPSNVGTSIPITFVSSEHSSFEITCNISIIKITPRFVGYTSIYDIVYDLSSIPTGPITVETVFTSAKGLQIFNLQEMNIIEPAQGIVLLDLTHTVWDSVLLNNRNYHLERLGSRDIQSVQTVMEQSGFWIEELMNERLDEVDLNRYDMVWLPSAFVSITPPFYDRPTRFDGLLSTDEIFALYEYYQSGGKLLVDFAGSSEFDSEFDDVSVDKVSLTSLLGLLGVQFSNTEIRGTAHIDSTIFGSYDVSHSEYSLAGGFQITTSDDMIASLFGGNAQHGQFTVFNSRNWRTRSDTLNKGLLDFQRNIVTNMESPIISSVIPSRINQETIELQIDSLYLELIDIQQIQVDGKPVSFQQTMNPEGFSLTLNAPDNSEMELVIDVNGSDLTWSGIIDTTEPVLGLTMTNGTNTGHILHFSVDEPSDIINNTIRVNSQTATVVEVQVTDNELIIHLQESTADTVIDIRLIDIHGHLYSNEFTIVPQNTSVITSSAKEMRSYHYKSISGLVLVLILVKRKVKRQV